VGITSKLDLVSCSITGSQSRRPVHQLSKWVNLSDTSRSTSTTSYISLVKLDPVTALVVYSCDVAMDENKSETGGLEAFSMRITLT
jgi:hypothetical protein